MNKNLPEGWKWVKLGDIAFEVSDRIDNPSKSGLERFVGLEHIDSESLTVKRWGSTEDVTSAMKLFKKGDMLFARRNAYLKRASMATFDGVCSGDAIVLRQKNEKYVDGLLPLILNTEKLWEFAIANASGSMSKRVKWRDLATFEIPLPPKDEQRRIADILWAAEDYIVKNEKLVDEAEFYKKISMKELLTKGIGHKEFIETEFGKIPKGWKIKTAKETLYIKGRIGWKGLKKSEFMTTGPYLITGMHFVDDKIDWANCFHITMERYLESPEIQVKNNDILLTKDGTIGKVALIDYLPGPASLNSHLLLLRPLENDLYPKFVFYVLLSDLFKRYVENFKSGSTLTGLSQSNFENFRYLYPPYEEQKRIVEVISKVDEVIQKAKENITKTKTLKMSLLNNLLMGDSCIAFENKYSKKLYETQVS